MASHELYKNTIKVLEQSHVSAPPGSVPPTKIPLTFFDIQWLCCPIEVLFFFHLPQPTQHFTSTIIPNLKTSLSLALRHFFPLAADLHLPPPPHKPYLLYPDGGSVQFTVAESSADFNAVIASHGRDAKELHPFAPKLPNVDSLPSDGEATTFVLPVFALQVTIFPNFGFCIGHDLNHVAADGSSMTHFMKSWASICKNLQTLDSPSFDTLHLEEAPFHDKEAVKGPFEVQDSLLTSFYTYTLNQVRSKGKNVTDSKGKVIASSTFIMSRARINALKSWASTQFASDEETQALHASTFVVACASTWVNLVKVQTIGDPSEDKTCHIGILVNCRTRKGFEFPEAYFGNCIAVCPVAMKRSELVAENAIFDVAKAIAAEIIKIGSGAIFTGADKWISSWKEAQESENLLLIGSSPNFRVYEIDFGWGRLEKFQLIPSDNIRAISLAENRNEEGGLEIGVELNQDEMNMFVALSEQNSNHFIK